MSDDPEVEASCPRCDEPITGQEGQCPSCGLDFLDEEGGLSQDAVEAMLEDADIEEPGPLPHGGYYTPQWVRLIVGLAICVPIAPLILFVVESVVQLPLWADSVVFMVGWFIPGYLLSRLALPSVIVAVGLLLIGATMALTPLAIVAGRTVVGSEATGIGALGGDVWAAQGVFLAVGLAVLVLGGLVYRQATRKRDDWAQRASENEQ